MINKKLLENIICKHYSYLEGAEFKGWDVLDGLNSKLFQRLPFHQNKYCRLVWIQLFRRSPINFRKVTFVPKGYNPKALALFISGLLNWYGYTKDESYLRRAFNLYEYLIQMKSENYAGLSWGYNFDWQARAFNVPKFKPNMVCSVFGGHALLDLFEATEESYYLKEAEQVAEFILNHLALIEEPDKICFAYIPGEPAVIHNVNLLGAAYLSRLFEITGKQEYRVLAEKSVRFSVGQQRADGAWVYGNENHHGWVDNFHTGYNLVSIYQYQQYCQDDQFEKSVTKGLDFHLRNHYKKDGLPKYSDVNLYPLDIHCFAQAILTFLALREYIPDSEKRIEATFNHLVHLLWDKKRYYFYYKKARLYRSKIPYIRWSQAWMFYTLTYLLYSSRNGFRI